MAFSQTHINPLAQHLLADVTHLQAQHAQLALHALLNHCVQPHQYVELSALGITPVLSLHNSAPAFQGIQVPVAALRGRVFSWNLRLGAGCLPLSQVMIQIGTGNRVNRCDIVFEIYQAEQRIAHATRAGESLEDNGWAVFTFDKPVAAGNYQCRLCSPDSDNAHNTLFLWLTFSTPDPVSQLSHYHYPEPETHSLQQRLDTLRNLPRFSILVDAFGKEADYLNVYLDSIAQQIYPSWDVHLLHDEVNFAVSRDFAKRFPQQVQLYSQFRAVPLSQRYQQLFEAAQNEYVVLLPIEDIFGKDALLSVAELLEIQQPAMIYADEDSIDNVGIHSAPVFKPDCSPEWLMSKNYCGNFAVYRSKYLQRVGGFAEFEDYPSLCWDVALRMFAQYPEIAHIPQILHHRRQLPDSLPNLQVVQAALNRETTIQAYASLDDVSQTVRVRYALKIQPLVSIVIPTRDLAPVLLRCLNSLQQLTQYPHWEVVIVDNGSVETTTQNILHYYQTLWGSRLKIVSDAAAFNFSRLVNRGVQAAQGEYILLLNNDTELLNPKNWLELMLGYAQLPAIACVGAKLLYPDHTIQHAGIICGVGGLANHGHRYFKAEHSGYLQRLDVVSNYSAITGACLLVKRAQWVEVGGFDEQLAVAFNDVDFCLKLSERGYRHVVLPQVQFYHHESLTRGLESTPEKQQRFEQEQRMMQQRWGIRLQQDPYYNIHLTRTREDFSLAESSPYYA